MKLVRNTTSDGSCKYALLRIDKMLKDGEFTFIQDFLEKYPELKKYIEFGEPNTEEEFFVIKLKDINSTRALTAYVLESDKTDPEFALEVMDLALRSGKRHTSCKQPDLLEDSEIIKNTIETKDPIKHNGTDKKFIVVQNTSLSKFEEEVNNNLNKGYTLHGNTRTIISPDLKIYGAGFVYIQPMLKEE